MAVVTIVVCRAAKTRDTKWITRPRLKEALFFFFQKLQKEERTCLKAYRDFCEEKGNNALICEFHFDSGDKNLFMGQGKKRLERNVDPKFEDMKKPVVESKREHPAARKSLFEEIGEPSQEQMNDKTHEVSETICINCHNCKEEKEKISETKN